MTNTEEQILRQSVASLEKSKLIDLIINQAKSLEKLEKLEELEAELKRLRSDLDKALRSEKRQAAPFGKSKPKSDPKPRGQKKGHKGHYRTASSAITEHQESPLDYCPKCGNSTILGKMPLDQIIEEIPLLQPRIVALRTWQGRCSCCGPVRSTHPLQVSKARGSAKVHLGPGAIAWLLKFRHDYGLSIPKAAKLFEAAFGLPISQGAVSHLEHRLAKKLLPDYEALLEQARQANVLHADETSWYVGQSGWWLWVFANKHLTLYEVNQSRARQVLEQTLDDSFKGTLVSDCLNIYDGFCEKQQKCYAHHLKAIKSALQSCPKSSYLKLLRNFLKRVISYQACRESFNPPDFERLCLLIEARADQILPCNKAADGKYSFDKQQCPFDLNQTELKVAQRLAKQRKHLFTFLYQEQVPATNNLAERQLRPAVIQRKISCGNRTPKGAQSWKILRSLAATAQQNQQNFSIPIFQALKRDLLSR